MYTIDVMIPNAPLIIRRTFNLDTTLEAEQVVAYCQKHKLECKVTGHATQSTNHVCNEIDKELYLAAERRVA